MPSIFAGLNISKMGLFAQQRALHTISHNVANANTEGYSRQRVDFSATNPEQLPGTYGMLGTGVDVDAVKQIRNEYLDFAYRGENSTLGEYEVYDDVLTNIEGIFNEPTDASVTKLMNNFYSALQELNKAPENLTTRALVRQRGIALAEGIKSMSESLQKLQKDTNFELTVSVTDINGYAQQIAALNKQIYNSELTGGTANDLRDQRNLILDKMSKITKLDYYDDQEGRFHVSINGHEVVNHFNYDQLVTVARSEKVNEDDVANLVDLKWESGADFRSSEGSIHAIIEMRDNMEGSNKGVPYYVDKLNEFVDTLASELNNIHSQGYGLNGTTDVNFFTFSDMSTADYNKWMINNGLDKGPALDVTASITQGIDTTTEPMTDKIEEANADIIRDNINTLLKNNPDYAKKSVKLIDGKYYLTDRIKADTISISSDIDKDLNKIAAASSSNNIPGNGVNALKMAGSRSNVKLFEWGSPDDFVKSLVANLAVDKSEATRVYKNQTTLVSQVTVEKDSYSGVSLDEEMSDMIRFQQAYSANARMLTTFDEMIDIVVNKMGLVGR